jgi:hypothetical protein
MAEKYDPKKAHHAATPKTAMQIHLILDNIRASHFEASHQDVIVGCALTQVFNEDLVPRFGEGPHVNDQWRST